MADVHDLAARFPHGCVRYAGQPVWRTLGTGNAVFGGGVVSVHPDGGRTWLAPPARTWLWPLILAATGLGTMLATGIAMASTWWVLTCIVEGVFGAAFGVLTIGALLLARERAQHRLVVDARRVGLAYLCKGREVVFLPADSIRRARIRVFANQGYADVHDVLLDLGPLDVWIHQTLDLGAAQSFAAACARLLRVPHDETPQRDAA